MFVGGMFLQANYPIFLSYESGTPTGVENTSSGETGSSKPSLNTRLPDWLQEIPLHPEDKGLGNPEAPVTLTEYIDFQCPYCRRHYAQAFPKILEQYIQTGKVYYRIRHFPIPRMHDQAIPTAVASECASDQGKFWAFHHLAFANAKKLSSETLSKIGKLVKVPDYDQFKECLGNRAKREIVRRELNKGRRKGISGTPATFVNGDTMISGARPFSLFRRRIEAALKQARRTQTSSGKPTPTDNSALDSSNQGKTVRFTLQPARERPPIFKNRGGLVFRGKGGEIDGKQNPTLQVERGQTVQLQLVNIQGEAHNLAVSGYRRKSHRLTNQNTGNSIRFVADKPGDFTYFCTNANHRRAGMEGTIRVK